LLQSGYILNDFATDRFERHVVVNGHVVLHFAQRVNLADWHVDPRALLHLNQRVKYFVFVELSKRFVIRDILRRRPDIMMRPSPIRLR
jgi:hypothetical protein